MNLEEYSLKDIFNAPAINQGITKRFCQKNKGNIPVYASSKNEHDVIGFISDNIKDVKYYKDCITYNRNGSVGRVFYRNGKFAINEDARVLVLKDEFKNKALYSYLRYILEEILTKKFDYSNKAGINKVMQLKIKLPPIDKQNIIIAKFNLIQELKEKIGLYASKIESSKIITDFEDVSYFTSSRNRRNI